MAVRTTRVLGHVFGFWALLALGAAGCGAEAVTDPTGGNGSDDDDDDDFSFEVPERRDSDDGTPGLGGDGDGTCEPNLTGLVRDFKDSHPDFEAYSGNGASKGIVEAALGDDRKPVYAGSGKFEDADNGAQVTGPDTFEQWYRDTDGVNESFEHRLELTELDNGLSSFESDAFFPADGKGFGDQGRKHNYHFTFELHTEFVYEGGEVFTFKGDDDLWVFINGRLALDLGGLHPEVTDTVDLDEIADEFGLKMGDTYRLELFHAERHTHHSNFRIDTNIKFTNCDPIIIL